MSLKMKTALILFTILGLFSMLNIVIQQKVIYPSFIELEKSEAKTNISRVNEAFENELKHLRTFCLDWAHWNDSYEFLKDSNQAYIENNLMQSTFELNSLFHISYHLNDETTVFSRSYNKELKQPRENDDLNALIPLFIRKIKSRGRKPEDRGITGILNTHEGPILLTVQTVMNSEGTSDIPGIMLMAKYISSNLLASVKEQVEVEFDFRMKKEVTLDEINTIKITDKNDGTYLVEQFVPTVKGREALVFFTSYPRSISQQGKHSIITAQLIMFLTLIVLMIVIHTLITRVIITPIKEVTAAARKIRKESDYDHTITKSSTDEIGSMISEFNGMIAMIRSQTEKLNALARVDGLTGLFNRRTLDEILEVELHRMQREQQPISVLLIDIDHFKKYNDHFGHLKGDSALKKVADVLGAAISRTTDVATRYGGEEFCIVLPNTNEVGAESVAKRICTSVTELNIKHTVEEPLPIVTVSIGTATIIPNEHSNSDGLMKKADDALYEAKKSGRNRWVSAGE